MSTKPGFGENKGRVERFRQLHTVKQMAPGRRVKEVRLLAGGKIVAKSFDKSNLQQVKAFEREVKNLELAKNCAFVPRLLAVDRENMTIYTKFCGEPPKQYTEELKKQVREKVEQLRTKHQLIRTFHSRLDGLPKLESLAINKKDGQVNITDLGPSSFQPVTTISVTIPIPKKSTK